jgi:hypothetical protein
MPGQSAASAYVGTTLRDIADPIPAQAASDGRRLNETDIRWLVQVHMQREYAKQFTLRQLFVGIPILGVAVDINDVALLGGATLIFLMLLLSFSLARQHENLYLCLHKIRRLILDDPSPERGESDANFLYHALVMSQLFLHPPTLARSSSAGRFISRIASTLLYLVPVTVMFCVVRVDHRGYLGFATNYRTLYPKAALPPEHLALEICFLAILAGFAGLCWLISHVCETRFRHCFYLINPGQRGLKRHGLLHWWRLRDLWPQLTSEERLIWKELTPDDIVKTLPKKETPNEVSATVHVRGAVGRILRRRMARNLTFVARSQALKTCGEKASIFTRLCVPSVCKSERIDDRWNVTVNWPFEHGSDIKAKD